MMSSSPSTPFEQDVDADMVLIGGGIMSATLASMLAVLEPDWKVVILERADRLAAESSDPWNNAGTGHSGFCELNYMPDPADGRKAATIAADFHLSRQWWAHLADNGLLDPTVFIHTTPHMDVVFNADDVAYLRQRFNTLSRDPLFEQMEFSDDPAVVAQWAPLVMDGRDPAEHVAATRHPEGTDVDFGALTRELTKLALARGAHLRLNHHVRGLRQNDNGIWIVRGAADGGEPFSMRARRVFVGAGGHALRLLQHARLPEIKGYGVLPVGAAFLRCSIPDVVDQHTAKVYGQAEVGAPPMSVPHLDKRVVGERGHLMFGPYATFSTKLLKHGRWTDFFTTLRWHNLHVIAAAVLQNLTLITYLVKELSASRRKKIAQLHRYYPTADPDQWEMIAAGQRAQLITPDRRRVGVIQQGTELVVAADGTIAGLLGASPGASTAVPIIIDLLQRSFPHQWRASWAHTLTDVLPGLINDQWDTTTVTDTFRPVDRRLIRATRTERSQQPPSALTEYPGAVPPEPTTEREHGYDL